MSVPTVVDIFAGAGGLSQGFKQAGFSNITAYELHPDAIATYALNHGKNTIRQKNVRELSPVEIRKHSNSNNIDVLIGGPPCQGFSTYGKKNQYDQRNNLIFEYFRIVKELKPEIFVFENVPGLFRLYNGKFWNKLSKIMSELDYKICASLLKASDYGVPQLRERLIVIGARNHSIYFPATSKNFEEEEFYINGINKPDRYLSFEQFKRNVSVKEAINDLRFLPPGERSEKYQLDTDSNYQRILKRDSKILHNHEAVNHSSRTVLRYKLMEIGKGNDSLPEELKTRRISTRKLIPEQVCRTVTSSPEDFVHYTQPRIITIRELARIQTFPDSYGFLGPRTTGGFKRRISCVQPQQLGNAVPPFLAQAVAEGVAKMLSFNTVNTISNILTKLRN